MKVCENCKRRYKDHANYCVLCGIQLSSQIEKVSATLEGEKTVHISYMVDETESQVVCKVFPALMGRDSSSVDVPVFHPSVSRKHCRLSVQGETLLIEDVGSSNGTFVNGQRISEATPITSGDEVVIGKLNIRVHVDTSTTIGEG